MSNICLTKKQELVVNNINKKVLVSASAGSGKTFVVVERIIKRVIEDKIDIDKILVVTFTNAAASELKERISKKLNEKLKENIGNKELEKYIHRQIGLLRVSNISTIHSFCLSVIRSSFYYLEIEPAVKTIEQSKSILMILEILDNILEEEYEKKEQAFIDALELFVSEDNLIKTILDLYYFVKNIENYEKWLDEKSEIYGTKYFENMDLTSLNFGKNIFLNIQSQLKVIKKDLEYICLKLSRVPEMSKRLDICNLLAEKIDTALMLKTYDEIYSYIPVLLDNKRFGAVKTEDEELKNESSNIMKNINIELKNIDKIVYKDTKGIIEDLNSMKDITSCLINIVKKLDKEYMLEKNKKGYIDFNDYEHLTLKALENEEIRKEYLEKFEEIYIDEYQDTSSIQDKVISQIAKENNVVMVGDLKQSIYSFRNADPSLLSDKYEEYEDILENENDKIIKGKIILSQNFRSRKEVLDSVNYIFSKVMSKKYGGIEYNQKEFLKESGIYEIDNSGKYKTEINIIDSKEYLEEISDNEDEEVEEEKEGSNLNNSEEEISLTKDERTKVELEAAAVGNRINQFINDKFEVYDFKTKKYRPVEYRDIVILMRAPNLKIQTISDVLFNMNIPVFSDSSEGFYESEEVGLVISFIKVLNNHLDDISLASIMYSIIGNFTLDDLTVIKKVEKDDYLYNSILKFRENSDDLFLNEKIDKFLALISDFRNHIRVYSVSDTLQKMYNDTGIYYSLYLEENGQNKCMKLDTLLELAKNFEREEKAILPNFIRYIESIKKKADKGESTPKLLGENENVVRVMTIHKSKGLEFPIVIFCDSNKNYYMKNANGSFILNKELGIGINIYNKELGITYPGNIMESIKEKIQDDVISEELRLLYVAMTRAKEKLCIFASIKDIDAVIEKASSDIKQNSEKIDIDIIKSSKSHFKVILNAIVKGYVEKEEKFLKSFEVNILKPKDKNDDENVLNLDKEPISNKTNIDRQVSPKEKFLDVVFKLNKNNSISDDNKIKNDVENFKKEIEKIYKYKDSLNIKQKYTVTELKEEGNKNNDELTGFNKKVNDNKNNFMPKVLEANIDSMSYGTIIHKIIEKIDLRNKSISKTDIENITRIIVSKYEKIKDNEIFKIVDMVYEFLNSEIRSFLDDAIKIKKEVEYVSLEKLENLKNINLSEKTLVQGIVDLYVETKDGSKIIIDFKTDRVKNEQELIDKYKYQLEIYKSGIENVMNTKIDGLYIYSFTLKKMILVI